ncbi:sensor histidine kinase [Bacillus horti]|uniref:histidine kinase n=1 Tax=Caldalkalibacillus horti TaxID=77523 RepID=A0ABT9W503_9BACI|nr:HAMP domain-containing sensor histidine kinase [Bacillus horti]MDQ0168311.1 signal transduction histidine kinase [Bacillus horti]
MNLEKKLGLHYFKFVIGIVVQGIILYIFLFILYAIITRLPFMHWFFEIDLAEALILAFLGFVPPILVFILIAGLIFGRRMSSPIFYHLKWIDHLAAGNYTAPEVNEYANRKNMRFFTLYQELTEKMELLTTRLQQNDVERKELEKMRKEWTSGVTHDLKTPLSYIQGYSTMLLSEKHTWSPEEQTHFLKIMREKAAHMQHLIDDLSDSLQFEQGSVPLDKESIDIVAFLHRLVEDIKQQPNALHHQFDVSSDKESFMYSFDSYLLKRALTNFLMNAVIHNETKTNITVSLTCELKAIHITIADDGIGMSESQIEHLFERYFRGTATDIPTAGTGLGMAIAKQFIVAHQGKIKVDSTLGEGTSIQVTLPLVN